MVKNLSVNIGDRFNPWVWEDPVEKEMVTHSSILT